MICERTKAGNTQAISAVLWCHI